MAYIFQTYTMPHINYVSSALFLVSAEITTMRSHAAFKEYKKIILRLLKRTFRLPLRGSP